MEVIHVYSADDAVYGGGYFTFDVKLEKFKV